MLNLRILPVDVEGSSLRYDLLPKAPEDEHREKVLMDVDGMEILSTQTFRRFRVLKTYLLRFYIDHRFT